MIPFNDALKSMAVPFEPSETQLTDALEATSLDRVAFLYDVGGGKTFVSTLISVVWDSDTNLIIVPPILIPQWYDWLKACNQESVCVYYGPNRNLTQLDYKWVITSHAIFRTDVKEIKGRLLGRRLNVVVDEAQALKNARSKLFKGVYDIVMPDNQSILLTATPTTKPEDTYAYMRIKTPRLYRSFGHWENIHVDSRDIFGSVTAYRNLEQLAENFALKTFKRSKQEIYGDRLEPLFPVIPYELSKPHKKLYDRLLEEMMLILPNGEKIDATTAQSLRHKMQQIVLNFAHFSGNPENRSAAFDVLDQSIEEIDPMDKSKSKFCIWTYYQSSSRLVTSYLSEKFGPGAVCAAYGGVNSAKSVDRIMNDPETRFMVAQPKSVGVGLNLQHVCSEMLFLEMSTVPMDARQAFGRVDRPGQRVRPTIRLARAIGTVQMQLFDNLLKNDDLVSQVERTPTSLRQELLGEIR